MIFSNKMKLTLLPQTPNVQKRRYDIPAKSVVNKKLPLVTPISEFIKIKGSHARTITLKTLKNLLCSNLAFEPPHLGGGEKHVELNSETDFFAELEGTLLLIRRPTASEYSALLRSTTASLSQRGHHHVSVI
jgi:hypothetical protein